VIALTLIGGLILLVVGGEFLVRGASKLALAFGLSPLVIGLTVVAFGTSAPELAVSIKASLSGSADIAVGNVVGSNIFNVLFILGVSALITPLVVAQQMVKKEVPIMIGASLIAYAMAFDRTIAQWEGVILFIGIIAYTWMAVRSTFKEKQAIKDEYAQEIGGSSEAKEAKTPKSIAASLAFVLGGLAILVFGSELLVKAAVQLARGWGISELVIGLTIVATGTSLPEVAASTIAAIKGERDIAVGNVVGSNIFNILSVLGLSSIVSPSGLPVSEGALSFDFPIMIAAAVACLPVFYIGYSISRWRGLMFLGYYIAYTIYLVLDAQNHPSSSGIGAALLYFVIPLTVLTLGYMTFHEVKSSRRLGKR
jgi:cation:H+ antiporter